MMKKVLLIGTVSLTLVVLGSGPAQASLCPQNPDGSCARANVAYSYVQRGHDQYGDQFRRTCHVSVRGQRWCGPWR